MTALRRVRVFFRSDEAAVTAEFVIGFSVLFTMFLLMLELFFLMVRVTSLQNALDITVRDVRLGLVVNPTVTSLEADICDQMLLPEDCKTSLTLEFTKIDLTTFAMPDQTEPCSRRSADVMAGRVSETYATGTENELMAVRACMVVDTLTPLMSDMFRIYARAAFVNEPAD